MDPCNAAPSLYDEVLAPERENGGGLVIHADEE
jgi:hypothetical protein